MTLKCDKALDFELRTECAHMVYSVSQQGPPSDHNEDPRISPRSSAWLGSHSSRSQDEAVTLPSGVGNLPSLFLDTPGPPIGGINMNDPLLSFASISPSGLDALDQSPTGSF
ncbi:hypothetical protein FRC11_001895 [Ceratobasidium sp. 423]|nr:hypothetical protein FRC11_001895 [Ceratobasidium sp. 423]